jgi:uncharacterized membrane protein YphA (DoxX/SURF4 family)
MAMTTRQPLVQVFRLAMCKASGECWAVAAGPSDRSSGLVEALLFWPPTWFVARLMLVSAYVLGGVAKLLDWSGAVAEQAHFAVHPPALWAAVTIAVELGGSLLVLTSRFVWLGAVMLGGFTLIAAVIANRFWALAGSERFHATNAFFEHVGLAGAFIIVALVASLIPRATTQ